MKPLRKVQAGGILRKSLDNTWRTPPKLREPAISYFPGGRVPFDAATGLDNPMRAERFCVGRLDAVAPDLVPGPMPETGGAKKVAAWLEDVRTYRRSVRDAKARRVSVLRWFLRAGGLAGELSQSVNVADDAGFAMDETFAAERAGREPFVSGLEVAWDAPTWVNPPYGRELRAWLEKMSREAKFGAEVMALLPCARWEQRYFHKMLSAVRPLHVCLITSRVAFESSLDGELVGGNPYANFIIGHNTDAARFYDTWSPLGLVQEWKTMRRPRLEVPREVFDLFGGQIPR